nr:ABC transporter ATP-binding protein [Limosilactobacillus equigenerosi]
MTMATIKIKQVTKRFGRHVILDNVTTTLEAGKIYGLLGRNGAGKSTLLNLINDRNFATSGEILFDGEPINNNPAARQQMYLMSETNMYPKRTRVKELFKAADRGYGDFDFTLAHRLTNEFGIDENSMVDNLSTGLTTIAKLITALCVKADFIFLDEPTLGLDASHREMFYRELLKTYERRPRTFVLSTHLISEVQNLIEHVIILDNREFKVDQPSEELLAQAFAISGPTAEVDAITKELPILGSHEIGHIKTVYVVQPIDAMQLATSSVTVKHLDLQTTFIALTDGKEL